jgi:shikimate dehydrogenase
MNIFNIQRNRISAETDLYCIFGKPVRHSLSPAMQNAAFAKCCINAVYIAFEVDDIRTAIQAMRDLNICGASVTIPFKNDAVKYIDQIDPAAEDIKAINTLLNKNGMIVGYNTDAEGAVRALVNNNINISDSSVLLLGNGGSARTIAFALLRKGATITIAGRNIDRVVSLVNDLKKKGSINYILINDIYDDIMQDIDIIINATSVGMAPYSEDTPMKGDLIRKKHVVFDIVYTPDMTRLLRTAERKGCRIIHGKEMLINQGAAQFEIWTGRKAPFSVMEKTVRKFLK